MAGSSAIGGAQHSLLDRSAFACNVPAAARLGHAAWSQPLPCLHMVRQGESRFLLQACDQSCRPCSPACQGHRKCWHTPPHYPYAVYPPMKTFKMLFRSSLILRMTTPPVSSVASTLRRARAYGLFKVGLGKGCVTQAQGALDSDRQAIRSPRLTLRPQLHERTPDQSAQGRRRGLFRLALAALETRPGGACRAKAVSRASRPRMRHARASYAPQSS